MKKSILRRFSAIGLLVGLLLNVQVIYSAQQPDEDIPCVQDATGKLLMLGGLFTAAYGASQISWPPKASDDHKAYCCTVAGVATFVAGVKIWTSHSLRRTIYRFNERQNNQNQVYPVDQATYDSDPDDVV